MRVLVPKGIFYETTYVYVLTARTKFQVSSITLTSFRQRGKLPLSHLKTNPKKPALIRVNEQSEYIRKLHYCPTVFHKLCYDEHVMV